MVPEWNPVFVFIESLLEGSLMCTSECRKVVIAAMGILLLAITASGMAIIPITTNGAAQESPAIANMTIVWEDARNGNYDIYMWDPGSGERPVIESPGDQRYPDIDPAGSGRIVWQDNRNGTWDISMWDQDGSIKSLSMSNGDQQNPAIYGDVVVWADNRYGDWDIFYWDRNDKRENVLARFEGDQERPAVSQDVIVWSDHRNETSYIGSDLWFVRRTSTGFSDPSPLLSFSWSPGQQVDPAVDGHKVIWTDWRYDTADISWYDIDVNDSVPHAIINARGAQICPAIAQGYFVYADREVGDIYSSYSNGYITQPGGQENPDIWVNGDKAGIVWQDDRNGNNDIYAAWSSYARIGSNPAGATVFLDGILLGKTPVTMPYIRQGDHDLTFSLPGYQTLSSAVRVTEESATYLAELAMKSQGHTGTLTLSSRPVGAAVSLDGTGAGTAPVTILGIAPGSHRAIFSLAGYETSAITVDVTENAAITRTVSLVRVNGTTTTPTPYEKVTTSSTTTTAKPGLFWVGALIALATVGILLRHSRP